MPPCCLNSMRPSTVCTRSKWFSLLNLKSRYWQVKMDKERKLLTAFTARAIGTLQMWRNAFWVDQCPHHFSAGWWRPGLRDLNLNWCIIYLDDIINLFKRPCTSHFMGLERPCLRMLDHAGLKSKTMQSVICSVNKSPTVRHTISAQGIVTHGQEYCRSLRSDPTPTTITEVQSFLRFTGYRCQLISRFI